MTDRLSYLHDANYFNALPRKLLIKRYGLLPTRGLLTYLRDHMRISPGYRIAERDLHVIGLETGFTNEELRQFIEDAVDTLELRDGYLYDLDLSEAMGNFDAGREAMRAGGKKSGEVRRQKISPEAPQSKVVQSTFEGEREPSKVSIRTSTNQDNLNQGSEGGVGETEPPSGFFVPPDGCSLIAGTRYCATDDITAESIIGHYARHGLNRDTLLFGATVLDRHYAKHPHQIKTGPSIFHDMTAPFVINECLKHENLKLGIAQKRGPRNNGPPNPGRTPTTQSESKFANLAIKK